MPFSFILFRRFEYGFDDFWSACKFVTYSWATVTIRMSSSIKVLDFSLHSTRLIITAQFVFCLKLIYLWANRTAPSERKREREGVCVGYDAKSNTKLALHSTIKNCQIPVFSICTSAQRQPYCCFFGIVRAYVRKTINRQSCPSHNTKFYNFHLAIHMRICEWYRKIAIFFEAVRSSNAVF